MTTTSEQKGAIYGAMIAIASEVPSIAKGQKNAAQGYQFRGIDDVFNCLQPIMAKHGVFMSAEIIALDRMERPSKSGGVMAFVTSRVRYSFIAKDGSSVSTESAGEGADSGDKATAKSLSIAMKYALLQAFMVPTADTKDPEHDNPEPAYVEPTPAPAPRPLTADQGIVITKLLADLAGIGKDTADLIERVKAKADIAEFPNDLTEEQAAKLIVSWAGIVKKASK